MTWLRINTAGDLLKINGAGDLLLIDDAASNGYPTTPMWRDATITSYSPTFVSLTHGLVRQVRSRGGHQWQIELFYGAMSRSSFAALWAFVNKQAGQYGVFDWSPGASFATQGTGVGTPLVAGGSQSGTSLTTDGWGASQTVMKAGDFFSVAGDPKVYQLTADVTSNGSGQATMEFFPALRLTPADNAVIDISPVFRCAFAADTLPTDWNQCVQSIGFSVSLIEVQ